MTIEKLPPNTSRSYVPTIPKKKKLISENYLPTQNQDNPYGFFNHEEQKIENQTPQPNTANERHVPIPKKNNTYELFNHEEKHEEQKIENQIPQPTNMRATKKGLNNALKKWQDMSKEQRATIGLDKFIKQHKLKVTFRHYADRNGLTKLGNQRLSNIMHTHSFAQLNPKHLKKWNNMCQKKQNNNIDTFCAEHNLLKANFIKYCNSNGMTPIGNQLIQESNGHEFNHITPEILEEWSKYPQNERDYELRDDFVKRHNIEIADIMRYIRIYKEDTLSLEGKQRIQKAQGHKFNPITKEVIQRWCNMFQYERDKIGLRKFAVKNNLYYVTLRTYVSQYEPLPRGVELLNKPDKIAKVHRPTTIKKYNKPQLNIYEIMGLKKLK